MVRLPRHPLFWLATVILWFCTLWLLSSSARAMEEMPKIANIDKVLHFGFFFGGSGLMSAFLFRLRPLSPKWGLIILGSVVFVAIVGGLDEFHQSFVPGRSGNDPFDWLADVSGGFCGALLFKRLHRLLK